MSKKVRGRSIRSKVSESGDCDTNFQVRNPGLEPVIEEKEENTAPKSKGLKKVTWATEETPSQRKHEKCEEKPQEPVSKVDVALYAKSHSVIDVGLDVFQNKLPFSRLTLLLKVRKVVSPFELYLSLVDFPYNYDEWSEEMQKFYNDPEKNEKNKVMHQVPLPGRCYVYQDRVKFRWHRVRIIQVTQLVKEPAVDNPGKYSVVLYFLDTCKKVATTNLENLREIVPEFAEPTCDVIRCYLYDIISTEEDPMNWSKAARSKVKEIVEGKEFIAIVQARTNIRVGKFPWLPDYIPVFGVVLTEMLPKSRRSAPNVCTVNAQMVHSGLAMPTGPLSSCKHVGFLPGLEPEYPVPQEPTPVVTTELLELLAKTAHSSPADFYEVEFNWRGGPVITHNTKKLPRDFYDRIGVVDLVIVRSPADIYVQFKSKLSELQAMEAAIKLEVETDDDQTREEVKIGMFVASNGQNAGVRHVWQRGVVVAIMDMEKDAKLYEVLFVDYGRASTMGHESIRPLPEQFEKIPSFATRIHIAEEGVIPADLSGFWCGKALEEFVSYIAYWNTRKPTYVLGKTPNSEDIELDDMHDSIMYSSMAGKWINKPKESNTPLKELKNHPALRYLFISHACELYYEANYPHGQFWYFYKLTEDLLRNGHAWNLRRTLITAKDIHEKIIGTKDASTKTVKKKTGTSKTTGKTK